jgi:predicted nucleic acid-binding Zn ribbon protein
VPVYVYRRQDGSTFEIEQRITEDRLVRCPTTGQKIERVLQPFTHATRAPGSTRQTTGNPRPGSSRMAASNGARWVYRRSW